MQPLCHLGQCFDFFSLLCFLVYLFYLFNLEVFVTYQM